MRALIVIAALALAVGTASAQRVSAEQHTPAAPSDSEQSNSKPRAEDTAAQEGKAGAGYRPNCRNPKDHDAADFCQQERAADAAMRAADSAADAVRVSDKQTWLLWFTFGASVCAVIAAFRSANSAHKTLEGLERPFLHITPILATRIGGVPTKFNGLTESNVSVHVSYAITNHGRSPGTVCAISLAGCAESSALLASINTPPNWVKDLSIFTPQGSVPVERPVVEIPITIRREQIEAFARGDGPIFIAGRVQYDSVFGNRYETFFCWRYLGRDQLISQGGGDFNGDRRVSMWANKTAHAAGIWMGRYAPFWATDFVARVLDRRQRRPSAADNERRQRPDNP